MLALPDALEPSSEQRRWCSPAKAPDARAAGVAAPTKRQKEFEICPTTASGYLLRPRLAGAGGTCQARTAGHDRNT